MISACLGWVCLNIFNMSNDWFQFRQFLVRQDQSAMKVGTDGVLLGAWTACENCRTVLDIGTGTGLIALMIAQRNPDANITAVEIDAAAAQQAVGNIGESLWADRISVLGADFLSVDSAGDNKFDLIICNPPFFTRSLKNPDLQRAQARHDDDLPLGLLIVKSAELLSDDGRLALIIPAGRVDEVMSIAADNELFLSRQLNIRGNSLAPVKRVIIEFCRESGGAEIAELVIESGVRGVYTEEYKRLTGDFYL